MSFELRVVRHAIMSLVGENLEAADRTIERMPEAKGYVRYMDDTIWFCPDKPSARQSLAKAVELLEGERLTVKSQRWVQPVSLGVHYCGYRILPHRILLSRRKKRAYQKHLKRWQPVGCGEVRTASIEKSPPTLQK